MTMQRRVRLVSDFLFRELARRQEQELGSKQEVYAWKHLSRAPCPGSE